MQKLLIYKSLFDERAEEQLQWLLEKALPQDTAIHLERFKTDIKSFALKSFIDFIQLALQTRIELYKHSQDYDVQQVFNTTNKVARKTIDILYNFFWDKQNEKHTKEMQIKVMQAILKPNQSSRQQSMNEGFDDKISDSDNDSKNVSATQTRRKNLEVQVMALNEYEEEIPEKASKEISMLKDKIKYLESILADMTTAYFRDMKSLQENLFQEKEEDFIIVDYFDQMQKLDEKQKVAVRTLMESVKVAYKSSISSLHRQLQLVERNVKKYRINQKAEHFKKQLQILMNKNDPQSLLKAILFIEKNPYKLWKEIQDTVGNKFFFQVFQSPQHNYGINYREIDQLLFYSGADNRLFQTVKDKNSMDNQLAILAKQTKDQLEMLQLQQVQIQNDIYISKGEKTLKAKMEERYQNIIKIETERVQTEVLNIYETQQRMWFKDWQKVDFLKLIISAQTRAAISRWSIFSKFIRFSSIITQLLKNLDVSQKQICDVQNSLDSKNILQVDEQMILMRKMLVNECKSKRIQDDGLLKQLDFHIREIFLQLNQTKIQYEIERDTNEILNNKNIQLQNELDQNKSYISHLRQVKLKLEHQQQRYEKAYGYLLSKLNFRKNEIPLESYSQAGQITQSRHIVNLINRIKKLSMGDRIITEEYTEFQDKCELVAFGVGNQDMNNLGGKNYKDSFTQTLFSEIPNPNQPKIVPNQPKIVQNTRLDVPVYNDVEKTVNSINTPASKLSKKFFQKIVFHVGVQVDFDQKSKTDLNFDTQQFQKITPLSFTSEQTQMSQLKQLQKSIKSDEQYITPLIQIVEKKQLHTISYNQHSLDNNSSTFEQLDNSQNKKVSFYKETISPEVKENHEQKKKSVKHVKERRPQQIIQQLGQSLEVKRQTRHQEDVRMYFKCNQQQVQKGESNFDQLDSNSRARNRSVDQNSDFRIPEHNQSAQNTNQIFFDPQRSIDKSYIRKYGKLMIGSNASKMSNIILDSNYLSAQQDQQNLVLKLIKYEQKHENQIIQLSSRIRDRQKLSQTATKVQKQSERSGRLPFVKDDSLIFEPKLQINGQQTRWKNSSLSPTQTINAQIKFF